MSTVTEVGTTTAAERPSPVASNAVAQRVRRALPTVGLYIASIAVALLLCGILVSATHGSASKVFSALLDGSIRSPGAWGLTITTAVPLLVVAVGTIVSSRAGLVNIGQEGQLLLGTAGAAYVLTRLNAPGPILLTVAFLVGTAVGAVWVGIAAVMKYTRKVPEVISTLLLAFIALQISAFLLTKKYLLLSRAKVQNNTNAGQPLPADARLPKITIFGN